MNMLLNDESLTNQSILTNTLVCEYFEGNVT